MGLALVEWRRAMSREHLLSKGGLNLSRDTGWLCLLAVQQRRQSRYLRQQTRYLALICVVVMGFGVLAVIGMLFSALSGVLPWLTG